MSSQQTLETLHLRAPPRPSDPVSHSRSRAGGAYDPAAIAGGSDGPALPGAAITSPRLRCRGYRLERGTWVHEPATEPALILVAGPARRAWPARTTSTTSFTARCSSEPPTVPPRMPGWLGRGQPGSRTRRSHVDDGPCAVLVTGSGSGLAQRSDRRTIVGFFDRGPAVRKVRFRCPAVGWWLRLGGRRWRRCGLA
jgi:hypothetical protein